MMDWYLLAYVVIALFGLIIAGSAVQAYRREGETVLLLVAGGFALVGTHGVVEYGAEHLFTVSDLAGEVIEVGFIGLAMVLFVVALYGPLGLGGR